MPKMPNTNILKTVSHIVIVISGMLIILLVADHFNNAMVFIDNNMTKTLMLLLSILSIFLGAQMLGLIHNVLRKIRRKPQKPAGDAPHV